MFLQKLGARQWHALKQTWQRLPKSQKILAAAAAAELLWIIALQVQVAQLESTVYTQEVRLAQLEKQAQKQNNFLYSAQQDLSSLKDALHDLNFRVLDNTWRIDKPNDKTPESL